MVSFTINLLLLSFMLDLLLSPVCWAKEPKTNETFLREMVFELLNKSVWEVMPQTGDTLYLAEEGKHPGSWLLKEELLSHFIMQNKKEVFLLDSTGSSNLASPSSESREILRYRLTELEVSYPRAERENFLGKKFIVRQGKVAAFFYLVNATSGEVLWQNRGENVKFDKIGADDLKKVENGNFSFLSGELPSGATKKYVEPAIVTAVVGGLIYLFFANR